MSTAPEQVRGVYVSANTVGYVPLNNYPNTGEYGVTLANEANFSDANPSATVAAAAAAPAVSASEPRRCFFSRFRCCNPVAFPRLSCTSKLFLLLAVALAGTALGTHSWYNRSYHVGADEPLAAELGYAVDYRESIGLFKVCYHLTTTPVPNVNASAPVADPMDVKHCVKVYDIFGRRHMPPPPQPPSDDEPPQDMPQPHGMAAYDHHEREGHHGRGHRNPCKGLLVFCATKGALIVSFVCAGLTLLFTCIERRGCCIRRKRGVVITQSVFATLTFVAVLSASLFAAAGSSSIVTKPASGPLAEVLQSQVTGPINLGFRFSCSFFTALGAVLLSALSMLLFIIRSSRLVEQIANEPAQRS